jgi:hypothetical protein
MEPPSERDAAAVARTAARCDPSRDLGLLPEVLPEPRLSFGEERGSSVFVLGSHRPRRNRDHDAAVRMDHDPQHSGT